MPWLRLDDGFTSNPKIAALTDREFRVWMRLLCYCARTRRSLVDELPRTEVAGLSAGRIARFLELDLLVENEATCDVEINDWDAFNPPKDRTQADRAKRYRKRKQQPASRVTSPVTSPVTTRDASRVTSRVASRARAGAPVPVPYIDLRAVDTSSGSDPDARPLPGEPLDDDPTPTNSPELSIEQITPQLRSLT